MKKAKEYAREAQISGYTDDTLVEIVREFITETHEIIKQRKAKSNDAIIAVFKEQERKWNALRKLTGDWLSEMGYRKVMLKLYPYLADYGFCESE
jgi:hypothetical protein